MSYYRKSLFVSIEVNVSLWHGVLWEHLLKHLLLIIWK